MKIFFIRYGYLILVIITALFFYVFNLRYTYFFSGDMARDTLASLRILKNKEITAIGPPLSFGQYGIREIYFSSLTYYIGALGLFLFNKNVLGPIYINIFLMVIGIFYFYKLAKLFFDEKKSLWATIIFSLSPVIVAHLRFFWNPNFIISISPIYWYYYFLSLKKNEKINYLLSGFLAGILFHFHYFVIFTILISLIFLFRKNLRNSLFFILSFIIMVSPLILFEIKNQFYLTNALVYNITINKNFHNVYQPIFSRSIWLKLTDIFLIPVIFLAFQTEATHFPTLFNPSYWQMVFIGTIIYLATIFFLIKSKNKINFLTPFLTISFLTAIFSTLLAHEVYYLRYFFICLPLLALILTYLFNKKILLVVILIYLITNVGILYSQKAHNDLIAFKKTPYPTLQQMEKVGEIIKKEKPKEIYNITENFIGDARALYLRFFIEKNDDIKPPESETTYQNLKILFVFAPDLNTVYKENRWEFLATPNLKLTKTWKIDKNKYLFKFETKKIL